MSKMNNAAVSFLSNIALGKNTSTRPRERGGSSSSTTLEQQPPPLQQQQQQSQHLQVPSLKHQKVSSSTSSSSSSRSQITTSKEPLSSTSTNTTTTTPRSQLTASKEPLPPTKQIYLSNYLSKPIINNNNNNNNTGSQQLNNNNNNHTWIFNLPYPTYKSCEAKQGSQVVLNVKQQNVTLKKGDKFFFAMSVPTKVDRIVAVAAVVQDPIKAKPTDPTIDVVLQFERVYQEPIPRSVFSDVPSLVDLAPSKSTFTRVSDSQLPLFLDVIRSYPTSRVKKEAINFLSGISLGDKKKLKTSTSQNNTPRGSGADIESSQTNQVNQTNQTTNAPVQNPHSNTSTPVVVPPNGIESNQSQQITNINPRKRNTIEDYLANYDLATTQRVYFTTSSGYPISVFSLIKGESRKPNKVKGKLRDTDGFNSQLESGILAIKDSSGLFKMKETSYAHLLSANFIGNPIGMDEVDIDGVPIRYDPFFLDNTDLKTGKHRTVMNLPGYKVSILPYIKKSAIKEELNEQFRQKHEWVTQPGVTLYKIRKLKRKLKKIAMLSYLELSTLALSYVFLEKLILKNMVTKPTCKLYASTCLLLAAKFNDPKAMEGLSLLIEVIEKKYNIGKKELLASEFSVFNQLSFGLFVDYHDVLPHIERLKIELMGSDQPINLL